MNAKDKKLWGLAKEIASKKYKKPSAYKSGYIVKVYKDLGGEFKGEKNNNGLTRWYKEEWKNQRRETGYKKKGDVYRPTKRINKKTPVTFDELTLKELNDAQLEKLLKGRVQQFKAGNVWQFIKDIPVGTYRFLTRRNKKLNTLSDEIKTYAKIARQTYPKTPQKNIVNGYRTIFKDDRRKIYIKGKNVIIGVRGTVDGSDVMDDLKIAQGTLDKSKNFEDLVDIYEAVKKAFPDYNISFASHSLGSGMVAYLTKKYGKEIKGHSFNPALNFEMIRDPKFDIGNIKYHVIDGDPVSHSLAQFMNPEQVSFYESPHEKNNYFNVHALKNFTEV